MFLLSREGLIRSQRGVGTRVSRGGIRLPCVWVLMGGLGGFEVSGLAGLVVGPVVLALARELWEHRAIA